MGWFKIGKGVHQGCILPPCLFNFHAEYILWNDGLDETQARIKLAGKNIINLRYADYTTLMAESKEELKSLLMKVKEKSEKVESDQQLKKKMTARVTLSVIFQTEKKHRLMVASRSQNIVSVRKDKWESHIWGVGAEIFPENTWT